MRDIDLFQLGSRAKSGPRPASALTRRIYSNRMSRRNGARARPDQGVPHVQRDGFMTHITEDEVLDVRITALLSAGSSCGAGYAFIRFGERIAVYAHGLRMKTRA